MADDPRTYIRVHDGMPDHPKIEPLSDKAFRVLVSTWCWSSRQRTDGRVKRAVWNKRATPAVRRELATAGLVEEDGPDHFRLHDYLDWQRSKAEIDERDAERRAAKQKASALGNHRRWHTGPGGTPSPDCPHCTSHPGSQRDPNRDNGRDRNGIPEGSIRGIGIGIGRESGSVGGEGTDPNASDSKIAPAPIFDPENPRCAAHAHIPPGQPVPSCRTCADVRRQAIAAAEHVAAEETDARRQARADIAACPDCDDNGMRDFGDLVGRCTHPKLTEDGQP